MSTTDPRSKILTFLAGEIARKDWRQCVSIDLLYARGHGYHDEEIRSWTRAKDPEFFESLALTDQLASAIVEGAEGHADSIRDGSRRRYVVRTNQHLGGRQTHSFRLPFNARDEATDTPSIHVLREMLSKTIEHAGILMTMLDELAMFRAKARLLADAAPPAAADDLPPDAATGLYLDCPFVVDDFTWLKMAFDSYANRHDGGPKRASQLMLVFEAIRRDDRATIEFLRVMNTIILPLLRRLRLKEQPHLTKLGAAGE